MAEHSTIEWTGRTLGAMKTAAKRIGIDLAGYASRLARGERWCTGCKAWHHASRFSLDRSRGLGLSAQCLLAKRRPRTKRRPERETARYEVNLAVRYGRLPRANDVPCTDCAHTWKSGERRHEYDHHLGYEPEHRLHVQAVCTLCHADREKRRRHG